MGAPGRLSRAAELAAEETEVTDAVLVGRYAVQLAFASGHSTGIYTFRHLRGLCPCQECLA